MQEVFPKIEGHLDYTAMHIFEDKIIANDFYGRRYMIDIKTGIIIERLVEARF